MKKLLKFILGIVGIILLFFVIDLICIFTINRPLLAIKKDNVYKGLLYDTYICSEYTVPQIKTKGSKYTCVTMKFKEEESNEEHFFTAKVVEVHDGYIIVEPSEDEEERKSSNKFYIDYKSNINYKKGQILTITYSGIIYESYPAQIDVTNISIVESN